MHAWTAIATFDFRLSGGFESVPHCLINLILVLVGTYSSHDWRNQEEAGLNVQACKAGVPFVSAHSHTAKPHVPGGRV